MPLLVQKKLKPEGELGLWQISEPESFFQERLDLKAEEVDQLKKFKGRRHVEWLATRYLLHYLSGRKIRAALRKDDCGKPHMENASWHISISHSHDLAAVVAAPFPVGIDIQNFVGKIDRIAHKYMRTEETGSLEEASRLAHLHVYWGAKEALYKAYGRRSLDFKKHIFVEPFAYDLATGSCSGKIVKDDFEANYQLHYEKIGDYFLVYGMETTKTVNL